MSSVSVEFKAFLDPRFELLGRLSGQSHFDAIGRMISIWLYCTDRNTVCLSREMIDILVKKEGYSRWVIESGLGEEVDQLIRIKGTKGRIEWLNKLRSNASKGGKARSKSAKRDENGAFTSHVAGEVAGDSSSRVTSPSTSLRVPGPDSAPGYPADLDSEPSQTHKNLKIDKREKERPPKVAVSPSFDFEALYKLYPLKRGKAKGLKICRAKIKTTEDYDALRKSITRYKDDCERTGTYCQHFSTFMNGEWEDWLDPETGTGPDKDQTTDWVKVLQERKLRV